MSRDKLEQRYLEATPESRRRFEAARASTAGAVKGAYFHAPWPLSMDRGEGCHVCDVDGNRYVDFNNHHSAQILGHGNAAVGAAVEEQLERGAVLGGPAGAEVELAAEMCRRVASVERIRFTNSGTEATLHAVRLLRGVSGRPRVAKFEGGYHGSHDAVEISVAPPLDRAGPASAPVAVPGTGGISPGALAEALILPYDDEAAVEEQARDVDGRREQAAGVVADVEDEPLRAGLYNLDEGIFHRLVGVGVEAGEADVGVSAGRTLPRHALQIDGGPGDGDLHHFRLTLVDDAEHDDGVRGPAHLADYVKRRPAHDALSVYGEELVARAEAGFLGGAVRHGREREGVLVGVHFGADALIAADELEVLELVLLGRDVGGVRVVEGVDDAAHGGAGECEGVGRLVPIVFGVNGGPCVP